MIKLVVGEDKFIHVVSCNTHNLSVITDELALKDGSENLIDGRFNLIRRANDVSQAKILFLLLKLDLIKMKFMERIMLDAAELLKL